MIVTYLDEIAATLVRAEAAAYDRGMKDGKREMLNELTAIVEAKQLAARQDTEHQQSRSRAIEAGSTRPASDRKRAPKGIVGRLISRVLSSSPGLKPMEIIELAETDYEKMVQPPSLRNQLRRGLEQGQYRHAHGLWYLVDPRKDEAEGSSSEELPSASNRNPGQQHDAAAID